MIFKRMDRRLGSIQRSIHLCSLAVVLRNVPGVDRSPPKDDPRVNAFSPTGFLAVEGILVGVSTAPVFTLGPAFRILQYSQAHHIFGGFFSCVNCSY